MFQFNKFTIAHTKFHGDQPVFSRSWRRCLVVVLMYVQPLLLVRCLSRRVLRDDRACLYQVVPRQTERKLPVVSRLPRVHHMQQQHDVPGPAVPCQTRVGRQQEAMRLEF